jgi:DNA adenine methylase
VVRKAGHFRTFHNRFRNWAYFVGLTTSPTGPVINLLRIEENLSAAWQRLSGTYVENLPWLECAERYDRAHTFHYMDPPYWQTAGYGLDFPFENYERMAAFMRCCKGKVMVSINDHPDIRRVFEGFHFATLGICYTTANQRQGKTEITGELVIMNWAPAELGGLF